MWLPHMCPLLGTRSATQARALTGNQTSNPLVCRLGLNPLSHTSQGQGMHFKFPGASKPHSQCRQYTPDSVPCTSPQIQRLWLSASVLSAGRGMRSVPSARFAKLSSNLENGSFVLEGHAGTIGSSSVCV